MWCARNSSRAHEIVCLWNEVISGALEILFHWNEIVFRGNEIISGAHEIVSRVHEIVFHGNEIVFRGNEIHVISRAHEIKINLHVSLLCFRIYPF